VPAVPAGATAFNCVGDITVKEVAGVPANVTAVAPLKFEPAIVTVFPPDTDPDDGVRAVMVGVGAAV
jgi:hypothetical protein